MDCFVAPLLAMTTRLKFIEWPFPRDLPDGQIKSAPPERFVQPSRKKYSAFPNTQISSITLPSRPTEGRLAIVTDAGRDAVDAAASARNVVAGRSSDS
jgi:hypothetical protein